MAETPGLSDLKRWNIAAATERLMADVEEAISTATDGVEHAEGLAEQFAATVPAIVYSATVAAASNRKRRALIASLTSEAARLPRQARRLIKATIKQADRRAQRLALQARLDNRGA